MPKFIDKNKGAKPWGLAPLHLAMEWQLFFVV